MNPFILRFCSAGRAACTVVKAAVPVMLALSLFSTSPALLAHGDDDHGAAETAPVANNSASNRLYLSGDSTEVVAIYQDQRLQLFVDDWDSNTPIENAQVEVEWQGENVQAFAQGKGQYLTPPLSVPAHASIALSLSLQAGERSELLAGQMHLPEAAAAPHQHRSFSSWQLLMAGVVALVAGIGLGVFVAGRRAHKTATTPLLLFFMVLTLLPDTPALAHGDDTHEEPATAQTLLSSSEEKAARLADGSLFVPKRVQHLLQVRTVRADFQQQAFTAKLPATIVLDNSQHNEVRAAFAGQMQSAGTAFVQPGQRVQKNAVLMTLQAQYSGAELAQLNAALAQAKLDSQSAEQRYQRTKNLGDSLSTLEHERIALERDRTHAQYQSLQASLHQQTAIRAPQTGVISSVKVSPGARVESGALLFTVLGGGRNVIAYAPPEFRLNLHQGQTQARLSTGTRQVEIAFVGSAHALEDQQLPLYFRFDDSAGQFAIGESAQVLVETDQVQNGVRLPAGAVARADDGSKAVFVKTGAEQFSLRPARVQALANGEVLIMSGIKAGERVVTEGAALLAQLR